MLLRQIAAIVPHGQWYHWPYQSRHSLQISPVYESTGLARRHGPSWAGWKSGGYGRGSCRSVGKTRQPNRLSIIGSPNPDRSFCTLTGGQRDKANRTMEGSRTWPGHVLAAGNGRSLVRSLMPSPMGNAEGDAEGVGLPQDSGTGNSGAVLQEAIGEDCNLPGPTCYEATGPRRCRNRAVPGVGVPAPSTSGGPCRGAGVESPGP